jgi:hypothetical protein
MGLYLSSGSGHLVCIKTKDIKVESVLHTNKIMSVVVAVLVGIET